MKVSFKPLCIALPVQAMDYTVIKAVCTELSTKLTPAKIEKIVQADRFTLLIGIRTVEQSGWLRLCWNPACAHISVGDPPDGVPSIAEAFSFGEQLRYLLKGLAIIEVCQLDLNFWMYGDLIHTVIFRFMKVICTTRISSFLVFFCIKDWFLNCLGDTLTLYHKFVTSATCNISCDDGSYEEHLLSMYEVWKQRLMCWERFCMDSKCFFLSHSTVLWCWCRCEFRKSGRGW